MYPAVTVRCVSVTTGSTGTPLRVLKTGLSGCYWDAITAREMLWHRRDRSLPWHSIRYMDSKSAIYPSGLKASSWGALRIFSGKPVPAMACISRPTLRPSRVVAAQAAGVIC